MALQRELQGAAERAKELESTMKGKSSAAEKLSEAVAHAEAKAEQYHRRTLDLESQLSEQMQMMSTEQRQAARALKVAESAKVEVSRQLQDAQHECQKLKTKVDALCQHTEVPGRRTMDSSDKQISVTPDAATEDEVVSEQRNASGVASGPESAFDQDFQMLLQPTSSTREPIASNELHMVRKQVEIVQRDRDQLADELQKAIQQAQASEGAVIKCQAELSQLEDRHSIALELLGERNEHVEQLEMDIVEMKDIFHQQLEVCVDQLNQLKTSQSDTTELGRQQGKGDTNV